MEGEEEKSPEICKFYKEGKCRFGEECFNIHKGPVQEIKGKKLSRKTICQIPRKNDDESNVKNGKKPMKTASDVIRRIQWDEMMPPEFFVIGYLDRFEGIVEDDFTKFSNWGNLVSFEHILTKFLKIQRVDQSCFINM